MCSRNPFHPRSLMACAMMIKNEMVARPAVMFRLPVAVPPIGVRESQAGAECPAAESCPAGC